MKVNELIEELKQLPPDADVYYLDDGEYGPREIGAAKGGVIAKAYRPAYIGCEQTITGCFLGDHTTLEEWGL